MRVVAVLTIMLLAAAPATAGEDDDNIYEGKGWYVAAGSVSHDQAVRHARASARLRVIQRALGVKVQQTNIMQDMMMTMSIASSVSLGVTYDEEWGEIENDVQGGGRIKVTASLRARVRPIGGRDAPQFNASLKSDKIVAGDPLILRMESAINAEIGIYVLQANDKVARLIPGADGAPLQIKAGDQIRFPGKDVVMSSEPLKGQEENTEAFIVIASSKPILFKRLASGMVAATPDQTEENAINLKFFNRALANLKDDLRYVTITYLPYRVRERDPNKQ